ncbi:hypothetical protein BKA93DRAFT_84857 [Sparassis latifolia]
MAIDIYDTVSISCAPWSVGSISSSFCDSELQGPNPIAYNSALAVPVLGFKTREIESCVPVHSQLVQKCWREHDPLDRDQDILSISIQLFLVCWIAFSIPVVAEGARTWPVELFSALLWSREYVPQYSHPPFDLCGTDSLSCISYSLTPPFSLMNLSLTFLQSRWK